MRRTMKFLVFSVLLILFACTIILNYPPDKPTNPNPSNGAINIDGYQTTLSWSCSDPDNDKLTFDIYFGTSPDNLEKIAEKIQTNTYTITIPKYEILSKGTKYYWKIVVSDGKNQPVSGDIWEFTTATNYAPRIKRIISPKEGETGVSLTPKFEWEAYDPDGDKLYFDLYIGTEELTKLVSNLETTSYELSQDKKLTSKTEYRWKIIVKDNKGGQTESGVYKFTTTIPPSIPVLVLPKDGETIYSISNQLTLSWECSDPDGDTLTYDVYLGTDSNPPLVKSNHTSKSYQVTELESGKVYYWKIVAKDGKGGITEGPVWRFINGKKQVLVLVKDRNSINSEEKKVTDFLTLNGFEYMLADFKDIKENKITPKDFRVIYFRTDSEPTTFNDTSVLPKLKDAIDSGSHLILEYFGLYLIQYLGYGTVGRGSWGPVVYDTNAFVKVISNNKVFEGLKSWDPPVKPDQKEQFIHELTSTGGYTTVYLTSLKNQEQVKFWILTMTYGWFGQSTSSSYCQAWGGCTPERSVHESGVVYSKQNKGRVVVGSISWGSNAPCRLGEAGRIIAKNIIRLGLESVDW